MGKTVCCLTYHVGLVCAYLLYCFVKLWPLALATILLWSETIYFICEYVAQFCFAYWIGLPFEAGSGVWSLGATSRPTYGVCLFGLSKCMVYGQVFRNQVCIIVVMYSDKQLSNRNFLLM